MTTGLLVAASYQLSHAINDGSTGGGENDSPQNVNCRSCERASSDFDIRQHLTASSIWILPVGRGRPLLGNASPFWNAIFGGWQLSGIGRVRTGLPLNVTLSRSASALPDGINSSQRPDYVAGQSLYPAAGQTVQLWLNPLRLYRAEERRVGQRRAQPAARSWDLADRHFPRKANSVERTIRHQSSR